MSQKETVSQEQSFGDVDTSQESSFSKSNTPPIEEISNIGPMTLNQPGINDTEFNVSPLYDEEVVEEELFIDTDTPEQDDFSDSPMDWLYSYESADRDYENGWSYEG